ncbi:hypothetical protein DPMN_089026 [Dreissena polymorpha]|uniref:Uncharacterized protein n=1 Tax=Dreissena polymorpha TaxID=45954 RepID=A0A9D4KW55_DREPO|nr:hypothetical protein DPMN_089026 [Dreissena polymorpha]
MDVHCYSSMTHYQQRNGRTLQFRYDTVPAEKWTYIAIQVRHSTSREMDVHRYSGMTQYQQRNGQTSLFRYDTVPAEKSTYIAIQV